MKLTKLKRIPVYALMVIISAFLFMGGASALASATPPETLSVDEVWLTGDTLHIAVTDIDSGTAQTLELNLRDYAQSGDEYITVQATDANGNSSNSIQFKNPYYSPSDDAENSDAIGTESAIPNVSNAFTPDGTGTVVDNATDGDGKEFFTVGTEDGNTFYLIIDRERTSDNVYLLNAVTENDLASLAKPGDGFTETAIPTPTPTPEATPQPTAEPETPPAPEKGGSSGTIAFVVIAILAVGGVGYYIKIVRPKQNAPDDDGVSDSDKMQKSGK